MTGQDVRAFLEDLGRAGVHVTLNATGDGLTVTGQGRPSSAHLEALRVRKADALAFLRAQAAKGQTVAAGHSFPDGQAAGGEVVGNCDNLPAPPVSTKDPAGGQVVAGRHNLSASSSPDSVAPWEDLPGVPSDSEGVPVLEADNPAKGHGATRALPARPDWAQIAAQPGHCGSCARATPAPDWGADMVTCTCDSVAWWPLPPPHAMHVGTRCGAYLQPGAQIGSGYRARKTRPAFVQVAAPTPWEDLPALEGGAA